MSNYFDPDCGGEPIFTDEDQGYGFCSECGSALFIGGAVSDGDGSVYDTLNCRFCHEEHGRTNEIWFDDFGNRFKSEDEWLSHGHFLDEDDLAVKDWGYDNWGDNDYTDEDLPRD